MARPCSTTRRLTQLVLVLATCIVPAKGIAETPVAKARAVAPSLPGKTRVAHIGLIDVTAVAAKKGWLQEEFAKVNAKADLVLTRSPAGTSVETALLDRGELHITARMAYPALQHRLNGVDAVVIWQGVNSHPRRATTVVLADSDIHSVDDLKDKTLGASLVGCPYYASLEALRTQDVTVDTELRKGDVRFVNVTGTASTAAFLAGRFDAFAVHPASASTATLYIKKQVREIATAVPDGVYVTAGGRSVYFAMRKWALENPDLVKAFLTAWDRTVRWLSSDNGKHLDEAAGIAARELRIPKAVALYDLKDESRISWGWGVTDYKDAVAAIKKFQDYQIAVKDPFYTKHHLNDQEIEAFVDKRFFAGGDYFVDVSEKQQGTATGELGAKVLPTVQLACSNYSH